MDAGQARNRESTATDWLIADGEMGRLIRSKDWSQTAVGPPRRLAAKPEDRARHHAPFALPDVRLVGQGTHLLL